MGFFHRWCEHMLKSPVANTNGIDEYDQLVNLQNVSINTDSFTTWETVLIYFFVYCG